jgi:hypothetical protein
MYVYVCAEFLLWYMARNMLWSEKDNINKNLSVAMQVYVW